MKTFSPSKPQKEESCMLEFAMYKPIKTSIGSHYTFYLQTLKHKATNSHRKNKPSISWDLVDEWVGKVH